jgi:hypothetical protein
MSINEKVWTTAGGIVGLCKAFGIKALDFAQIQFSTDAFTQKLFETGLLSLFGGVCGYIGAKIIPVAWQLLKLSFRNLILKLKK